MSTVKDCDFVGNPDMAPRLFDRLAQYIHGTAGIRMPPEKRIMLQARLQKRMRRLGYQRYEDYVDYVFSPEGSREELQSMLDVVTTNKTDFFREPYHFEYLQGPDGIRALQRRFGPRLRLWSAPCSKGHEVYTLAMVLQQHADADSVFDYTVVGADLSTHALDVARRAVYPHREIEPVPMALRKRYLLRSRDAERDVVRIAPELRQRAQFLHLNFMDENYRIGEKFHAIFCRNMLIYFDAPTQAKVVNRLAQHLHPGGLFFTGHSETLARLQTPFVQVEPTVYRLPA